MTPPVRFLAPLHRFDRRSWRSSCFELFAGAGPSRKSCRSAGVEKRRMKHLSLHRARQASGKFGVPDIVVVLNFQTSGSAAPLHSPFKASSESTEQPCEVPISNHAGQQISVRKTRPSEHRPQSCRPPITRPPVKPTSRSVSAWLMLVTILPGPAPAAREDRVSSAPLSTTSRRLSASSDGLAGYAIPHSA